ncbi:hypothetical protein M408DRAFT_14571 [Serendipita vermifera MAFF 305830]|uniref:Poly A polymerase head domain-containing protein n=1 Tax=Serendipita vermifera MAFF 305830 TaxID=933852 RepID=A0A0C2X4F2_SERVB|nr:hypothetical protein M408DRAFT_14571 [Serendipita vermifera MAFF 305830]
MPISPMVVHLTPQEEDICTLINDFCTETNSKNPEQEPVVCRIAGGWVRDKLLGIDSHDVDIAINTMTGETFAQGLLDTGRVQSIGATIASNPEQSKHLATTCLKILGLEVDLVNLRSETYSKDSRIPTIEFGTPQEDADRRDLCINALFYNIHTREVEDFTGKGIEDLKGGLVRTPLEPKSTFEDDPLRVLRCVRFASRLGFQTVPEISEAAQEASIQSMLATKISRERIGEEMDKMIRGPDPVYAFQLLHSFKLLPSIFLPSPQAQESASSESRSMDEAVAGVTSLDMVLYPVAGGLPALDPLFTTTAISDKSARARLTFAAALTPFRGLTYELKKKRILLVESVLRDGLKLGSQNHYIDGIPRLFNAAEMIIQAFPQPLEGKNRVAIGKLLRHPCIQNPVTGSEWSLSILYSLVQELVTCWKDGVLDEQKATSVIDKYNKVATTIKELDLTGAITAAPILDGKAICDTLQVKPGPHMSTLVERVIEWQLEHPNGTVEECKSWLQQQHTIGALGNLPPMVGELPDRRKKRKVASENTDA